MGHIVMLYIYCMEVVFFFSDILLLHNVHFTICVMCVYYMKVEKVYLLQNSQTHMVIPPSAYCGTFNLMIIAQGSSRAIELPNLNWEHMSHLLMGCLNSIYEYYKNYRCIIMSIPWHLWILLISCKLIYERWWFPVPIPHTGVLRLRYHRTSKLNKGTSSG